MQTSNIHSRLRLRRVLMFLVVAGGIAALVAVLLAVVFIALPLTRRLIFVGLSEALLNGRLESLAVDLDIQPGLKWLFSLLIILPVGFGLSRMMLAREFSKALRGLALALGTLLALGIFAWARTQHFNFDAQGHPVVYLSFHRDGVRKSYHAGLDRVTGRPKQPVTLERVVWLTELVRQPVRAVDPAIEANWFDANSGEPNLWYVETTPGLRQFFNRPHFHQQLQVEARPITRELMAKWQVQHQRQVEQQNAEQRRREEAAKAEAQVKAQAAKQEADARAAERQRRLDEAVRVLERQQAEQAAAAKAAEISRLKAQEEEAQRLRAEWIQNRRTREAIAAPANLDYLEFGRMLSQVCPELTADSFQAKVCDEEYLERRFRFQAHVVHIKRDSRLVTFALQSFGQLHCVAMATVTPDTLSKLRENKPCILTATLISVRFSSNVTNINGVTGHLCLLEFGNATGIGPDPAYRAQKKPKPAKAAKSEPYFSPFSNFQENPPVTAAIGFTFENSVKLAFAPLALLNKALGGSKENKDHSSSYNQRPNP